MSQLDLIAIIVPKAGKADRVRQPLLTNMRFEKREHTDEKLIGGRAS